MTIEISDYYKNTVADKMDREVHKKSHDLIDKFDLLQRSDGEFSSKIDSLFIGRGPKAQQVKQMIELVSHSTHPILITGPSGCGKEVCAKTIHAISPRKNGPLISLNCGAIPQELIEAELFGHSKGAFTNAHQDRKGLFEQADGGTLFLDEIGEMPIGLQVRLLRILEDGMVRSVGGVSEKQVDVRIIAATNQNIGHMIGSSAFREDLYYRLSILSIAMPALCERREDIKELAEYFAHQIPGNLALQLEPLAWQTLRRHNWPGNVRELRNWVSRASLFAQQRPIDAIKADTLISMGCPSKNRSSGQSAKIDGMIGLAVHGAQKPEQIIGRDNQPLFNLKEYLDNEEQKYMRSALKKSAGVVQHAAQSLGMKRTTFVEKMKRHKITNLDKI